MNRKVGAGRERKKKSMEMVELKKILTIIHVISFSFLINIYSSSILTLKIRSTKKDITIPQLLLQHPPQIGGNRNITIEHFGVLVMI